MVHGIPLNFLISLVDEDPSVFRPRGTGIPHVPASPAILGRVLRAGMAGDVIGEVNHIVHPVFVNGRGNRRTATGSRDVVFGCKQRGRTLCVISDGIHAATVPGFQPGKVRLYHVIDLGLVELACRVDADPSMTDLGRPEWQGDEPVRADSACHSGDAYRYDGDGFLAFRGPHDPPA